MRLKLATIVFALITIAVTPVFAITVTGTPGCTSAVAGITSTITYNGPSTFDPAGYTTYTTPFFDQGTNPGCGADWLGLTTGQSTTVTFSTPVSYVGFAWGTPDGYNHVQFFNGNTQIGPTYNNSVVTNSYMNFFADTGEQFTSVVFSSGACCFETDNFSYTVIASGVPEPGTLGLIGSGILGVIGVARRRFLA